MITINVEAILFFKSSTFTWNYIFGVSITTSNPGQAMSVPRG
jgi:hypothetical protein